MITSHRFVLVPFSLVSLAMLVTSPAYAEKQAEPSPPAGDDASVEGAAAGTPGGRAEAAIGAQDVEPRSPDARTDADEIARRIDVLAAEIERLRLGEAAARAEGTQYGLGPAASKIYRQPRGVSLGGYGELLYQRFGDREKNDVLDFQRAILYAGYKFSDRFVLNTEIEIEHVDEIYLEFAYLDFLWRPELNVRAGLVLVPMGLVNELHEPTVFLGALRPETEQRLLPSTWRENGVGLFGDVGPLSYRAYLVNGMAAEGFSAAGVRGGRQKGARALAEDFAGVARVDLVAFPGVLAGGSVYYGQSDQDLGFDVPTLVYEGHLSLEWRGFDARALFARVHLQNVDRLNAALELTDADGVGERMQGWYAQLGFDLFTLFDAGGQGLVPFVRWERIDSQLAVPNGFRRDPANDVRVLTLGVNWYPIDQIVVKAEYQSRDDQASPGTDQWNALVGYVF